MGSPRRDVRRWLAGRWRARPLLQDACGDQIVYLGVIEAEQAGGELARVLAREGRGPDVGIGDPPEAGWRVLRRHGLVEARLLHSLEEPARLQVRVIGVVTDSLHHPGGNSGLLE
jgi:hypothetical protein